MHAKQTLNTMIALAALGLKQRQPKQPSKHENITENNNGQLAGKTEGSIDFASRNRPQNHGSRERG